MSHETRMSGPWIIVAGDFKKSGGMDRANWELADFLVKRGTHVHLVAHYVEETLAAQPGVTVHLALKPLGSYMLGGIFLSRKAEAVWRRLSNHEPQATIVANGGNCLVRGANWSHFVHHAWRPDYAGAPLLYRLKGTVERYLECRKERVAYRRAQVVIANSEATARHIEECLDGGYEKVHTVYLGSDNGWLPVAPAARSASRKAFGFDPKRLIALSVGGISFDNRKGFDVLLAAWQRLSESPEWDVDLVVAGSGRALTKWRNEVDRRGLNKRIRFIGFCNDMPALFAAADVLVSVPRYEPYGLTIQEALGSGLPAIISASAGIAERVPSEYAPLLIHDPSKPSECAQRLLTWRADQDHWRRLATRLGRELCVRTWTETAREMVEIIEAAYKVDGPSRACSVYSAP